MSQTNTLTLNVTVSEDVYHRADDRARSEGSSLIDLLREWTNEFGSADAEDRDVVVLHTTDEVQNHFNTILDKVKSEHV